MTQPCLHCGLECDDTFCCVGCATVHEALVNGGFSTFYEIGKPAGIPAYVSHEVDPSCLDAAEVSDGVAKTTWRLDGMHCQSCVWLVTNLPAVFPDVTDVSVDLAAGRIRFEHDPSFELKKAASWLQRFGLTPHRVGGFSAPASIAPIGFAWAIAANVMMIAIAFYAGLDFATEPALANFAAIASAVLTLGSMLLGRSIFIRAVASIYNAPSLKTPLSIDVPIAAGVSLAYIASVVALFNQSAEGLWFDSIAVIFAALLTSRWVNAEITRRVREFTQVESTVIPTSCQRLVEGRLVETDVGDLTIGDDVVVEINGVIPCDGRLFDAAMIDRRAFSGESEPMQVDADGFVRCGERALSRCRVRVTTVGEETLLAQMLSDERSDDKPTTVQLADRFAAWFTLFIGAAAVVGVIFGLADGTSLARAISVLIIACPCAAAMAAPLGFAVTLADARRRGWFVNSEATLERLTHVDYFAFDKTGTLTLGSFERVVTDVDDETLRYISALERQTDHPIAFAFKSVESPFIATDVVALENGLEGVVDGRRVKVVRSENDQTLDKNLTWVDAFIEDEFRGRIGLRDTLKPDAADAIGRLGSNVVVLSGDRYSVVESVCSSVGVAEFASRCTPAEKASRISELRSDGHIVAFVGDGLNDSQAFDAADVAICVHGAHANNYQRADLVFNEPSIGGLPRILDVARRNIRRIRWALGFSIFYNVVAVGFAISGHVTPLVAAIAMPLSSSIVVFAAARGSRGATAKRRVE